MDTRPTFTCVLLMILLSGCKSIDSTFLTRDETNTCWQEVKCLKGVPITLKVPTHLRVHVYEKHYLALTNVGDVNQLVYMKIPAPIRAVDYDFIRTEKIFTVDFKRPAAGTMNLTLDFKDNEQYFKQIQHDVVDQTIKDVTGLISALAPGGIFKGAASGANVDANVKEVQSVVAVKVFEIDSPSFELDLAEFLDCHVNKAHDAFVVPPGVDTITRVGIAQASGGISPALCPECQPGATTIPTVPSPQPNAPNPPAPGSETVAPSVAPSADQMFVPARPRRVNR